MVSAETSNKLSAAIAMDNDKPQTTVFIQKVYDLVQDPETSDTVSWEEPGDSFVIWRVGDFTEKVLPAYFKHSNMSSFVRQLNQYGFHKISHERWEFQHDFFKRDRPDLLSQIKRNRPERRKRTLTVTSGGGSSSSAFYGGSSGSARGPRTLPAAVATKLRPDAGAAYIQQHVNVPLAASQLLSEEDMNSFDASGSGDQRKPLWLSRLFGRGNKTIEIGKYGSLEDEAVRLRRDNSLLLQELSELRRLYARLEQRLMESEQRETEREEQFRHLQGFMLRIFSSVEIMNSQLANAGLDFLALDQEWTQALTYLAEHTDLPNQTDSNFCQVGAASGRLIHDADPLELLRSDGAPPEGVSLSNITSDSVGREVPQTTVADAYSSIQQSGTTDKELESLQERMQSMYQQESAGTQGFEMMLEQQRAAASRAAPELTPGAQGVRILSDDVLLPASTDSPGTV